MHDSCNIYLHAIQDVYDAANTEIHTCEIIHKRTFLKTNYEPTRVRKIQYIKADFEKVISGLTLMSFPKFHFLMSSDK